MHWSQKRPSRANCSTAQAKALAAGMPWLGQAGVGDTAARCGMQLHHAAHKPCTCPEQRHTVQAAPLPRLVEIPSRIPRPRRRQTQAGADLSRQQAGMPPIPTHRFPHCMLPKQAGRQANIPTPRLGRTRRQDSKQEAAGSAGRQGACGACAIASTQQAVGRNSCRGEEIPPTCEGIWRPQAQ